MNRCVIDAPTRAENLVTQDGKRLYATRRLRDWSGVVDVEVVEEAMPNVIWIESPAEVHQALAAGQLTQKVVLLSARGVIRKDPAGRKLYICKVADCPLEAKVSGTAMKAALGLAEIVGDVVLAAPVDRVFAKNLGL